MTITMTGLVVVALASWRIWHLIARDNITAPLRTLATKLRLDTFLTCPACLGLWITAALGALWMMIDHDALTIAFVILAAHGAWLSAMTVARWASQAGDDLIINQTKIASAQTDAAQANLDMTAEAKRTTALYTGRDVT